MRPSTVRRAAVSTTPPEVRGARAVLGPSAHRATPPANRSAVADPAAATVTTDGLYVRPALGRVLTVDGQPIEALGVAGA